MRLRNGHNIGFGSGVRRKGLPLLAYGGRACQGWTDERVARRQNLGLFGARRNVRQRRVVNGRERHATATARRFVLGEDVLCDAMHSLAQVNKSATVAETLRLTHKNVGLCTRKSKIRGSCTSTHDIGLHVCQSCASHCCLTFMRARHLSRTYFFAEKLTNFTLRTYGPLFTHHGNQSRAYSTSVCNQKYTPSVNTFVRIRSKKSVPYY